MPDTSFPQPPAPPLPRATPVVRIVRHEPLHAIREVLGISIHEVINDSGSKRRVCEFYRITRRIESEAWLRRELRRLADEAWIAAHL